MSSSSLRLLDGWCGVVVKTPDWGSKGPGFESRLTVHRKSRRLLNAFVIECDWRERGLLLTQAEWHKNPQRAQSRDQKYQKQQ